MRIKSGGALDRTVRHVTSDWGWPGAVLVVVGLLAFVLGPSMEWLDYRGVPNDLEPATALGVAILGLVWILAAAGYIGRRERNRHPSSSRRAKRRS